MKYLITCDHEAAEITDPEAKLNDEQKRDVLEDFAERHGMGSIKGLVIVPLPPNLFILQSAHKPLCRPSR